MNHDIFSFKNLLKAYYSCRKNKRRTVNAAKFELNFEAKLLRLEKELKNRTYCPGRSICFAITDPKLREIWAAPFRDRVIHHLLVNYLEPIFEPKFIFHSYACRKGKGAHKAVYYVKKAAAKNYYYFQTDIRSYFVSINKQILFSTLKKTIKNPDMLWLARTAIFNNPASDCEIKGDKRLLAAVPPHKSLFKSGNSRGLPIGNLTSQFFANVYLNELDQHIKHNLKCSGYFRYMDDFVLLHSSREQLRHWRKKIIIFLDAELKLKLHPKKQIIQPVKYGIDFCGYIIKPDYILVRRRTVKKLKNKLWHFNREIIALMAGAPGQAGRGSEGKIYDQIFSNPFYLFNNPKITEKFRHIYFSINSTYGFFKHADCYGLRKNLYEKHFGILKIYLRPANRDYHYFVWNEG